MYEILKSKRKQKGYTIETLANVIHTSAPNYYKKENGDVKFTVDEAILIAKFFKCKVESIFFKNQLSDNEKRR